MAERTLLLRVIADDRALQAAMARDQKAVTAFGKTTQTSLGKVDSAFTRTQRIAAGGFLGGAIVTSGLAALKSFSDAAAESEQVLGQTQAALESTGKSWADYGKQIEQAVAAQSRLGFDDEELLKTFSLFVRQTKDVGAALRNNNIAMDIARARFIDLEQAAAIVNKAALGQAGALRRIGIDAKSSASGLELLAQLEREFGGSAEKASQDASTSLDRLKVSTENLKESLGNVLLPAVAGVADELAEAADAAALLVGRLGDIGRVKIPEIKIPLGIEIGGGDASDFLSNAARGIAENVPNLGPLVKALKIASAANKKEAEKEIESSADEFGRLLGEIPEKYANAIKGNGFRDANPAAVAITDAIASLTQASRKALGDATAKTKAAIDKAAAETKLRDSFDRLIASLQLGVDRAELTKFLGDDIAKYRELADGLQKQIAAGIDVEQAKAELVQITGRIADLEQQQQDNLKRAAEAQKQARQFRALGLSSEGEEIVPGVENLEKRLRSALGRIASDDLDVGSKVADRLKLAAKLIKREGKNLTETTRRTIDEFIKAATGQDKQLDGPRTATSSLNVKKFLAGLELDPNLIRQLRSRLSSINSAGQALPGTVLPTGMFRGGVAAQVNAATPIDITLTMDGDVVARKTGFYDQRTKRRNPRQKTGPNSGI